MKINWRTRMNNKVIVVFLATLLYKILQDCGVIILWDQWEFYADVIIYILMVLGIVVDPTTPGIGDPPQVPIDKK